MCRNQFHQINDSKITVLNQNCVRLFCSLKLELMANHQESLQALEQKIRSLQSQHALFQSEITALQRELQQLKLQIGSEIEPIEAVKPTEVSKADLANFTEELTAKPVPQPPPMRTVSSPVELKKPVTKTPNSTSSWEKFIGENLINKIGILITVIGVGIGAKYAIDKELISPTLRIILGYLAGGGLLFTAMRLKPKYEEFSAVLLSGSLAIFYFITFIAFHLFQLMPQLAAFALMFIFTAFSVFSAIQYNKSIIAHLGLIGAYAIPFLLSDGSGNIRFFFTYMLLINSGILVVSVFKNWKSIFYVSFGVTWLIFLVWFNFYFRDHLHYTLAHVFALLFFTLFYAINIAYKIKHKISLVFGDIAFLVGNAFIYYFIGLALLEGYKDYDQYQGLFTLFNAAFHFGWSVLFFKKSWIDQKLFFTTAGLVLTFLTIAVPIQLDGNAVTLVWVFGATMLVALGRIKEIGIFEKIAFPILCLGILSLIHDWFTYYNPPASEISPIFNRQFLVSLLVVSAFGIQLWLTEKYKATSPWKPNSGMFAVVRTVVFLGLIFGCYFSILFEIEAFWHLKKFTYYKEAQALGKLQGNVLVSAYEQLTIIGFSMIYLTAFSFIVKRKSTSELLPIFTFIAQLTLIFAFLTIGLYSVNKMQLYYLNANADSIFYRGVGLVVVRFILFGIFGVFVWQTIQFIRTYFVTKNAFILTEYLLHTVLVWCLSAELVNWLHVFNSQQTYKLGLSIFWGIYALFLVALGIWKHKPYLRFGAFSLLGITLVKLFAYDISHLNTLSKTIVFIVLGVLLLLISFLYNKYTQSMFGENTLENKETEE